MQKQVSRWLGIMAVVATLSGLGTSARAAETTAATGEQATTGQVALTAGPGSGSGNAGGITLSEVPNITVKTATITGKLQRLDAFLDHRDHHTGQGDGKLQVINPGHKSNWAVTLQSSAFQSTTGTGTPDTLRASQLELGVPTVTVVDGQADTQLAPSLRPALTLPTTGTAGVVPVIGAAYDHERHEGVGTFDVQYLGTKQLVLAPGNVAGTYTADLTWTLTNTPL